MLVYDWLVGKGVNMYVYPEGESKNPRIIHTYACVIKLEVDELI